MYNQTCVQQPLMEPQKWSLLTGGCCLEVIYKIRVQNGTYKWWLLQNGGRYSQVVVSLSLTVSLKIETVKSKWLYFAGSLIRYNSECFSDVKFVSQKKSFKQKHIEIWKEFSHFEQWLVWTTICCLFKNNNSNNNKSNVHSSSWNLCEIWINE